MPSRPLVQVRDDDVLEIAASVRRFATAALGDHDDVEDVTQEAVTRLIDNRWRIDRRAAPGYAIATARSLLAGRRRATELAQRHQHRLIDPSYEPDPADVVLAAEAETALAAAFERLDEADRGLLNAHHVEGLSVATIARLHSSTPGAVAAALARARGRLRLEYCLHSHGRELSDERCRRILSAIATGDGRRQAALGASRHLPRCEDCTVLSAAVTAPDRHRAALGILTALLGLFALLRRLFQTHPVVSTASAGLTGAVVVAAVAYSPHHQAVPAPVAAPPPTTEATASPTPTPPLTGVLDGSRNLLALPAGVPLTTFVGRHVLGRRVRVLAVDADEGFWIGSPAKRIWVQLATHGESPITIKAGNVVDFAGKVEANPAGYAAKVGLTGKEDAAELTRQGVHIQVPVADVARPSP